MLSNVTLLWFLLVLIIAINVMDKLLFLYIYIYNCFYELYIKFTRVTETWLISHHIYCICIFTVHLNHICHHVCTEITIFHFSKWWTSFTLNFVTGHFNSPMLLRINVHHFAKFRQFIADIFEKDIGKNYFCFTYRPFCENCFIWRLRHKFGYKGSFKTSPARLV